MFVLLYLSHSERALYAGASSPITIAAAYVSVESTPSLAHPQRGLRHSIHGRRVTCRGYTSYSYETLDPSLQKAPDTKVPA